VTLWLLDTSAVSDIVHNGRGRVRQGINAAGVANVCTSIVVACELRYGAEKRGSTRLTERIEATLLELDVQPLGEDADRHYAWLRTSLERKGTPIGRNDMLIAAHALTLNAILVTANTSEFERVDGLRLENWLR
jgi:tRNA(fMet)-specific endonuclease VapC